MLMEILFSQPGISARCTTAQISQPAPPETLRPRRSATSVVRSVTAMLPKLGIREVGPRSAGDDRGEILTDTGACLFGRCFHGLAVCRIALTAEISGNPNLRVAWD